MAHETKEQILDAAENLFVERGIDAVSLRGITAKANVNLAAVHYHFGSKEGLVRAVFGRRVEPINRERIRLLDAAEAGAGDGPLRVEDVLRALISPAIRQSQSSAGGRPLMRLCGRIYAETADYMERIFDELFQDVVKRFGAAFARALPDLPEEDLGWRIHFCIGSMAHVMMESEKIRKYSFGVCDPSDVEGIIERLSSFLTAGMKAPPLEPGSKVVVSKLRADAGGQIEGRAEAIL